jgi:hypothetical protein
MDPCDELRMNLSARVLKKHNYSVDMVRHIFIEHGVYDNSLWPEEVDHIKNHPGDRQAVIAFAQKYMCH